MAAVSAAWWDDLSVDQWEPPVVESWVEPKAETMVGQMVGSTAHSQADDLAALTVARTVGQRDAMTAARKVLVTVAYLAGAWGDLMAAH